MKKPKLNSRVIGPDGPGQVIDLCRNSHDILVQRDNGTRALYCQKRGCEDYTPVYPIEDYVEEDRTLYSKKGDRYVPVAEHFTTDHWREGSYLVRIRPGRTSVTSEVHHLDYPGLLAAARETEDLICKLLSDACRAEHGEERLTKKQREAWEALEKAMGKKFVAYHNSHANIARAITAELIRRAAEVRRT